MLKRSVVSLSVLFALGVGAAPAGMIRHYTFDEGGGEEVVNHVELDPGRRALSGGPLGSMTIPFVAVNYPVPPGDSSYRPQPYRNPEWTEGRVPGKIALDCGSLTGGFHRSGISGAEFANGISLAGWVRLHNAQSTALVGAQGHTAGFALNAVWSPAGPKLSFRIGGPDAASRGSVSGGKMTPGVYEHFTAVFDGRTMKLYLNGAEVAAQPFSGKIRPCRPTLDIMTQRPFIELYTEFMRVAKASPPFQNGRVDFDELMIFDRALNGTEIAQLAAHNRPTGTVEQRQNAFRELQARQTRRDAIRMEIPSGTAGFYRVDRPVPLTLEIPAAAGLTGEHTFRIDISDLNGNFLRKQERKIRPGAPAAVENLQFNRCGVFLINVTLLDPAGKTVKKLPLPWSAGIVPPKPAKLLPDNPQGLWAVQDPFSYDTPTRRMAFWNTKVFRSEYEKQKKIVPELRYTLFFYWKLDGSPAAQKWNAAILDDAIRNLGQFPGLFALEMTSEPHNFRPVNYVKMLEQTVPAFRKAFPGILIAPPGGAPPSVPMIDEIVRQGGLRYMDALSFHPYNASPIPNFYESTANHQLKAIAGRDPKKKLEIWNSECMVKPLPRRAGRAMTEADAIRAKYPVAADNGYGFRLFGFSQTPEETSAAMQIQHILCDLAFGYRYYIICQSPNMFVSSPSAPGVALTALNGQVLNGVKGVRHLPLSDQNYFCALIPRNNRVTAALFSIFPGEVQLRAEPDKTYKTMDLYGNFGSVRADRDGLLNLRVGVAANYVFDLPVNVAESSRLKLDLDSASGDSDVISGTLTVTNPGTAPFRGTLNADELPGAKIVPLRTALELRPGETVRHRVTIMPEMLKRRMYSVGFRLFNADGKIVGTVRKRFASPGVLRQVRRIDRDMPLDGDATKYAGLPAMVSDRADDVILGKPNFAEPWIPQWQNRDDLSFTVRMGWKKTGSLHFLLEVRDDRVCPAPDDQIKRAFFYDSLELFFDSRKVSEQGRSVSPGADQCIVRPAAGEKSAPCVSWFGSAGNGPRIKVETIGRKTADGYLIEGVITPARPGAFRIAAGSRFRIDFVVNDTDEPGKTLRKSALALDGTAQNYLAPELWGRYELLNRPVQK